MEYEILSHTDKSQLESIVRSYLNQGWSCQGGVAVAVRIEGDNPYFFQAVVK